MNKFEIKTAISLIGYALVYYIFIYYGFKGIDWGFHWDEGKLFGGIVNVVDSRVLLPGWYSYPSATFWITLAVTWANGTLKDLPQIFSSNWTIYSLPNHFWVIPNWEYQHLINTIRPLFVVLSSSTSITIYTSCRLLSFNIRTSSICALLVLGSFPIFYHSRWITPDPLLMLFGSITTCLFIWTYKSPTPYKLIILSVGAGLALSSKYPGGLFLIYPLVAANCISFSTKRTAMVLCTFILTFLIITPGSILDPERFLRDISYELSHYKEIGHGIWTINPGIPHLSRILDFISFRGLASNEILSMALFILSLFGAYISYKKNRWLTINILIVPLLYILYFSTQKVMFIRNLLVILPFVFLFVGFTLNYIETKKTLGTIAIGIIITLGTFSTYTNLKYSTDSLFDSKAKISHDIKKYLSDNKEKTYLYSRQTQLILGINPEDIKPINPLTDKITYDGIIYELGEINLRTEAYLNKAAVGRYSNTRNLYEVIAGANELDLNYYPDWLGKKRFIVVKGPESEELAILNPTGRWGLINN